ncbi:cytochrome c1 [Pontixanthobacter aestiaquae]|uniref:Cytochrome c1 n=1 Tax=Pontixanthobacter aestiaquae TaxID=1509367 RepID=A0A844Z5D4_9SPHN|nr:cytochrome c1 [Pontixanthobacter aestiaquae]MDN3647019.1 cytochrome c1 [Pontixanthobacter aestiaquae]MXO82003.1 cytochrome c1 [Pontixanthobacter aestiaquae]
MIRIGGFLIGIGFTVVVLWSFAVGAYNFATEEKVGAAEYEFHKEPKDVSFAHDGAFGKWDKAQLQRGYQVYKEVCAACHSLKFVAFRDLADLGYNEDEVKALAAEWTVPGIDQDTGEAITRPGTPIDYFPSPYPNDIAAAAGNNNAIPPDLSLMTKARPNGTAYLYSLLTGYGEPSEELKAKYPDFSTPPGLSFNEYFPNLNLAMAQPIVIDDQVSYADGTSATVDQMAKDVTAFLTWTAEPSLVDRKQTGWPVLGFLLFATILAYFSKKQIWSAVKPKKAK